MRLDESVCSLPGVGEKKAKLLAKLGIETVGQLISNIPERHIDMRHIVTIDSLREGDIVTIEGRILTSSRWVSSTIFKFDFADDTGTIGVYMFNQPYMVGRYKKSEKYRLHGRVRSYNGIIKFDNPIMYEQKGAPDMEACYSLTKGISQRTFAGLVEIALEKVEIPDVFTREFLIHAGLMNELQELRSHHRPASPEEFEAARRSRSVKDLMVYQRLLSMLEGGKFFPIELGENLVEEFCSILPFSPTGAQRRAMQDVLEGLHSSELMNRLVQGDVGAGKTIVAFFAAYAAMSADYSTLFMAPTQILAEQHFETAQKLFGEQVALITSGIKKSERKIIERRITDGEVKFIIGTHALLFGEWDISKLGLIITDEQHRFGVAQRAALSRGNEGVNMLVMSATPIPRTLSLILYGSTGVSIIDELPPGRKPIKTYIVTERKRKAMYEWLLEQLSKGGQAYVTCPVVEENDELRSATEVSKELKKIFESYRVEMLHGRMTADKKTSIMRDFKDGNINILVSTTVIEVGVDVPNAHVMIIENAERFGLAQLHQLRGRVGRGTRESFCYLVSQEHSERLMVLKESQDGFYIAEKDLELRGGGDLLGKRQHGAMPIDISQIIFVQGVLKDAKAMFPKDYEKICRMAELHLKESDGLVLN